MIDPGTECKVDSLQMEGGTERRTESTTPPFHRPFEDGPHTPHTPEKPSSTSSGQQPLEMVDGRDERLLIGKDRGGYSDDECESLDHPGGPGKMGGQPGGNCK